MRGTYDAFLLSLPVQWNHFCRSHCDSSCGVGIIALILEQGRGVVYDKLDRLGTESTRAARPTSFYLATAFDSSKNLRHIRKGVRY